MVFSLSKLSLRIKRYDYKTHKNDHFSTRNLKIVFLGQNLTDFLTFFYKILRIKQGSIMCCSYYRKLHLWGFVGNFAQK